MDIASFGSWKSPIALEHLVKDAVVFHEIAHDGQKLYWTQLVPAQGRMQLATFNADDAVIDLAPEMSVRTRVHEYGGGALSAHEGMLYFVNDKDGRIYRLEKDKSPVPITPASHLRLADLSVSPGGASFFAVAEEHKENGNVINKLVKFNQAGIIQVVASGHDFYSSPRVSPDGKSLIWITWDHPQMPWDGSDLWMADLSKDGSVGAPRHIAGSTQESICNVRWSPRGDLYFISDRTGWWNLYRYRDGKIGALYPTQADFATPPWVFGNESYGFTDDGKLICVYGKEGVDYLAMLDPDTGVFNEINLPLTSIKKIIVSGKRAYFLGASPTQPSSLISYDVTTKQLEILKESVVCTLDEKRISIPQAIAFQTRYKDTSYGFYYPPTNPDFQAPEGELPPLIVKCHGGPTGHVQPVFSMETQFWTSRGFAFLDVNYSGSSGYGRVYRKRLEYMWGVRDVQDSLDGALFLVAQKLADPKKLFIRGGSAGGYTTLCALTFYDLFAGGTSYFGVSDPELLAKDTHKFESRYLDHLIAPYPSQRQTYHDRSPLQHIDRLSRPLLLLQGRDDAVVPVNQAQLVFDALKKKGTPVAMLIFEGEQHGFKMAKNIMRSMEAELYFYAQILNLSLPDRLEPVQIVEESH